jgi:hypothetical protein
MKSALERRTLCLVEFCLIAIGAGPSSASAATTVTITAPSTARVNSNNTADQDTTIIVSGHSDVDPAQVELKAEQGGSACTGANGGSVNPTESPAITPAGDYSKHFGFRPATAGNYHLCAYVYDSPPGPSPVATSPPADVQVHDRLSVFTVGSQAVAGRAATVAGAVQQPSESADWHFEYGLNSYGSVTPTHTKPPQPSGSGSGSSSVYDDLLSLEPATTYHYRLVATDGGGTVAGQDMMFTTAPASSMTLTVPSTRFTDEDWPVTVSGSAGQASGIVVYVEPNGSSCAATDTDEAKRPGAGRQQPYFGPGFGPGPGSVDAGQYSSSTSFYPLSTPGTYLVCAYLLANNRSQGPPEASASSLVTVSYRACPGLDFSVTGASEQTGDKAVFDAVLPADVGAKGTVVYIASSDGGRTVFAGGDFRPAGENLITQGGPQQVSTRLNKKKSFLPSYDGPVTVTFTITYAVATPYEHCALPDGTVKEGGQTAEIGGSGYKYPTIRSAPQTITVTFRNHGTPPDVASNIANAVGAALTPTGSAAKIGAILKKGYKASFKAKAAGQVTGDWYFVPKGAHVAGKPKPVLVASGKTSVKKPGSATLKLRVSKKGKALLKKAKKITLTTKGTFTPAGGKKVVVKRTIKLRR